MAASKFEQELDKHLEKYYPSVKSTPHHKTDELLEQGMSLFDTPGAKKTGLQKVAGGLGKVLGAPSAVRGAVQGMTRALDKGLTGTISQKLKDYAGKDIEKTTPTQTQTPDVNRDPAGFNATVKKQWQQLPPQVQKAYGTEAAYLNIKTMEAKHLKRR